MALWLKNCILRLGWRKELISFNSKEISDGEIECLSNGEIVCHGKSDF